MEAIAYGTPTGSFLSSRADPDFLLRSTRQRPRMRLSEKRGASTLPVTRHLTGNLGQSSDLQFAVSRSEVPVHRSSPLCHLDRSEAEWRDLQFPFYPKRLPRFHNFRFELSSRLERAARNGGTCCSTARWHHEVSTSRFPRQTGVGLL